MKNSNFIIIFFVLFVGAAHAQYISINDSKTPKELVQDILINNGCINTSSIKAVGEPNAKRPSYAYFSANSSNFPLSSGIILSTAPSRNAMGPFDEGDSGYGNTNWIGDADLDNSLSLDPKSTQATVLEFDFIALTNFISFNYIFASNEYQLDYPCKYYDGFAFLIKEANSSNPYKNLAVLPNSNITVSSTNIHPEIADNTETNDTKGGCPALNEEYFNGYNPRKNSPINYAGQTVVMNASTEVISGKKYHIKLVVADDYTHKFNSAVFIEEGSFKSKISLGEDRTVATNTALCNGDTLILSPSLSDPSCKYKWYKNNVEIVSADGNPTYEVTSPGIYKVSVKLGESCITSDEIVIEYLPRIKVKNTILVQCDTNNDGFTEFNLTKIDEILKKENSNIESISYSESLEDFSNIIDTGHYQNTISNSQKIYGRVQNKSGCSETFEIQLKISNNIIPNQSTFIICDDDSVPDGIHTFNLEKEVTPQILAGLQSILNVQYFATQEDAILETNPLPYRYSNRTAFDETIYTRIINGSDCYGTAAVPLKIKTFSPQNFEDETIYLCEGSTINLSVDTAFTSYLWNTGETSNSISVTTLGDYAVTVSNINGCQKTKKFTIKKSNIATISSVDVEYFSRDQNSILINYTGIGDYQFSLNGIDYQDNPLFTNVPAGKYNIIIRNKNGCGDSSMYETYVVDFPNFFTPNGDGYNDVWKIENLDKLPEFTLFIFDRYGKLLKQLSADAPEWDGIFNEESMPEDDYWFRLSFINGKEVKSHFSLVR